MTPWVRRGVKGGVDGLGEAHDLQLLAPAAEHDDPPRHGDHRHRPVDFGILQSRKDLPEFGQGCAVEGAHRPLLPDLGPGIAAPVPLLRFWALAARPPSRSPAASGRIGRSRAGVIPPRNLGVNGSRYGYQANAHLEATTHRCMLPFGDRQEFTRMLNSGSRWLRWDPHVHAPGTILNDQFGGDNAWDNYLKSLESAVPRIDAVGVTDYYCTVSL